MDNDGVSDEEDQDIDGDGFNNTLEINCNSDPQKNTSIPSDIDNDGICDTLDLDIDGDGLPNDWEEREALIRVMRKARSPAMEEVNIVLGPMMISHLQNRTIHFPHLKMELLRE